MILRFLAGCKPEEFDTFLDMAFKIVLPFISIESPLDMVHQVSDNIDLEQVRIILTLPSPPLLMLPPSSSSSSLFLLPPLPSPPHHHYIFLYS